MSAQQNCFSGKIDRAANTLRRRKSLLSPSEPAKFNKTKNKLQSKIAHFSKFAKIKFLLLQTLPGR
ncbi:MAG: hypothetical protein Q9P14_09895 [candidate division KSB1 bacterium]|nr:hypothetical protein [candidate division KSB1 bacterium]MDQ7063599.1 hypothetical protein [candidate division KSB1 bacterium]